ncbi:MAG TPA: glycoside hydrolase family 3 N-terminal domain-containing protein, partial [Ktedonobacterales bacterium]|nr:glycoside hydrolase family 3 N-terminal domain-containing protein [Ktedonobacterales bacterium]
MDVRWRREARSKVRVLRRWRAWALVILVAVIGIVSTDTYNSGPAAASRAPARRIAPSLELPAHFTRAARLTLADLANRYIARMTLDEKLGQLFLADLTGDSYDASTAAMVEQMHAGGIILYARSIVTTAQTRALVNAAQAHATFPLFVATDEEGGYVDRMQSIYGFRPSASQIGASGSRAFALSEGARVGRDMHGIGLNFDFGPDVDVQLVDGPDQSTRTYGSSPA